MRGKTRIDNDIPVAMGGDMPLKQKRRRQRKITPVELRRSANDWIQLIEEAKSKEQAWKFMREQMSDSMPLDSAS